MLRYEKMFRNTNFIREVFEIARNILEKNSDVVYNNSMEVNLEATLREGYQNHLHEFPTVYDFMCQMLNLFYDEVIRNDYENFGFFHSTLQISSKNYYYFLINKIQLFLYSTQCVNCIVC